MRGIVPNPSEGAHPCAHGLSRNPLRIRRTAGDAPTERSDARQKRRDVPATTFGGVILVGLTGGIGSGKSTVSAQLAERGAVIVDADAIARELQEPGMPLLGVLAERFGAEILREDGSLDRAALAAKAFTDPEELKALNAIVHPAIGAEIRRRIDEQAPSDRVVILDVALMVENDGRRRYGVDQVIVVDTPVDVAVERLVRYRGFDEADARARISRQATREQRREIANRIVDNGGTPDELAAQIDPLWEWIMSLPPSVWPPPGEGDSAPLM